MVLVSPISQTELGTKNHYCFEVFDNIVLVITHSGNMGSKAPKTHATVPTYLGLFFGQSVVSAVIS